MHARTHALSPFPVANFCGRSRNCFHDASLWKLKLLTDPLNTISEPPIRTPPSNIAFETTIISQSQLAAPNKHTMAAVNMPPMSQQQMNQQMNQQMHQQMPPQMNHHQMNSHASSQLSPTMNPQMNSQMNSQMGSQGMPQMNHLPTPHIITPKTPVGFDSLPRQIEKKLLKRGFQFNVICVGKNLQSMNTKRQTLTLCNFRPNGTWQVYTHQHTIRFKFAQVKGSGSP